MRLAPSLTTPKAWEADLSFPVCASLKDNDWGPASKSPDPEDAEMISVFSDSDSELEAKKSRSSLWRRRRYSDDAPEGVLLRALKALSFEGAFLQTQRYPVAQVSNPCLEIDGIGLVGLPLSPPFAQALLGERRCSARLEIPAEELRFTNPEWDAWLHKEARTICTDLSGKKNKPMYRLKKLVLEGSNAQAAESPSSEEAIATLVVFLPSAFEGGDILFEHGVQSATVRLGPQSHLFTSLVAAYSIVNTNLSLITSGYRLSLHYEVLDLAPFPDTDGPVRVLLEALVDWKETKRPSVLAYFMRRQYPLADDFTLQALAGSDALLMAHLQRMASELDFHLYVVQVQHSAYSYGDYDGPLDPVIPSEIENAEGVEEYWPSETQVNAFDMNSVPVDVEGFDFTDKSGSEYLNGELWDVEPKIEYETEYHPKILIKQTWNRTLFLLWPASDDAKVQPVKVRYSAEYARAALCSAGSFNPSRLRDKVLAKSLQESCRTGEERRDSVRELCKVAEARADGQMFLRILSAYDVAKNVDLIGLEMCVSAYRKFGWEVLKDFFCDAVQKDVSNPRRQQLVEQLHHVATRQSDSVVATWAEEQQDLMPRSLNRVSDNEIDWLLDLTFIPPAQNAATPVRILGSLHS
ncbi:hypothetical protein B0H16DRAFT_738487 [Mycena metata]|uniref:Uncharacterized protein n=1 Tax=Mycena metata TaxID=1033252 RepID=A0AAD7J1D2_9AGAR|nr:hypothetical protein B0H16DRAFT_738487 [Mycena metata]